MPARARAERIPLLSGAMFDPEIGAIAGASPTNSKPKSSRSFVARHATPLSLAACGVLGTVLFLSGRAHHPATPGSALGAVTDAQIAAAMTSDLPPTTTTPDVVAETTTPDVETTTSDVETDPAPAPDATEAAADELTTQSMDELATHDNDVAAEPLDSAPDADVDVDVDEPEPAPEPAPAPLVEPVPTPVPEPAPVPADDHMPALVREPAMLPDGFGAKLEEIGDIEHGVRFIEKCGVPKDIVDYLGKDASKMDTLGDWMANHTEYHDFDASTELKEMERAWKATGKCHEEDDHVSDDDHDDHHHDDDDDHDDDDHDDHDHDHDHDHHDLARPSPYKAHHTGLPEWCSLSQRHS